MAAWMTLMQTQAAVVEQLESSLVNEVGLPLSWHEVLVRLEAAPDGKLRMQELARSVLLSKSGVTRLVDRMADAGLVKRDACASDRRVVYAGITDEGRDRLERALPVFLRGFDEYFAQHISDEDANAVRAALGKVLTAHGRADAGGCPSTYLQTPRRRVAAPAR
jgi:DNA-binding MarR family transcriptional regulator